jgi:ubiquinone/menaquinone biosynthesis C-methylase UbiE
MASTLVQQKFGAAAADYATSAAHATGPSLARLIALVDPRPDWRALDVATGAGHTAHALSPRVAHVIASDVTDEMLAQAAQLAADKGLANVETARADAGALPFDDESFDLVTCRLAAHHFPNPAAFVRESFRVLRPGGTFALVDNVSPDATMLPQATPAELSEAATVFNAYEKLRDPSHARALTLSEWLELMRSAGFCDPTHELLDQHIAFGPWTSRMRCDAATVARLEAMLAQEPLHTFLRPRVTAEGAMFTLQEAVIVGRKPERA